MQNVLVKTEQKRGMLTERIKAKSIELFGYEISQKELRLMVYVIYEAQNSKILNNVNAEEKELLFYWVEKEYLWVTGLGNIISISKSFWDKCNEILFLGYVDLSE